MRIDRLNNIKSIWLREKQRNNRRIVYFVMIVAAVAYLFVLSSVFLLKRNDGAVSSQAAVAQFEGEALRNHEAETIVAKVPTATTKSSALPTYRPAGKHRFAHVTPSASSMPEHSWKSTSGTGMKVYTTSSAAVKHIGSAAGSSGGGGGTIASSQSSTFGTSTSIMVVPTMARVSSRSLSAANTLAAEAQVLESTAQERVAKPGIRRLDGEDDPLEPFQDVPVGEGVWALLFLAMAYAGVMIYRKRKNA